MLTNGFGWPHVLIILAVLLIFFGARRLPDAARGIGRSMRVFRSEMRGMNDDDGQPGNGYPGTGPLGDDFATVWRPPSAGPAPAPAPGTPPTAAGSPPPW